MCCLLLRILNSKSDDCVIIDRVKSFKYLGTTIEYNNIIRYVTSR